MDQATIERIAKLIVSVAKQKPEKLIKSIAMGLPEIDPNAQALCRDIVGKVTSNDEAKAIEKIVEAVAQCKIYSTPEDSKKIYSAVKRLI